MANKNYERNDHKKSFFRYLVETFWHEKAPKGRTQRLVLNDRRIKLPTRDPKRCQHLRWKTALKLNGIRIQVSCRECGLIKSA